MPILRKNKVYKIFCQSSTSVNFIDVEGKIPIKWYKYDRNKNPLGIIPLKLILFISVWNIMRKY